MSMYIFFPMAFITIWNKTSFMSDVQKQYKNSEIEKDRRPKEKEGKERKGKERKGKETQ